MGDKKDGRFWMHMEKQSSVLGCQSWDSLVQVVSVEHLRKEKSGSVQHEEIN